MPDVLTFADYSVPEHHLTGVFRIGKVDNDPSVLWEMAATFEHDFSGSPLIDSMGELIGKAGKAKELQNNIGHIQEVLGSDDEAVTITQRWANRSGLLLPVERSFLNAEPLTGKIELAVITGGVRNWMERRGKRLMALHEKHDIGHALLVGGNRPMKAVEGPDVDEGMTEADYLRSVVSEKLSDLGIANETIPVKSDIGDEVMAAGAREIRKSNSKDVRVAVVSNAGAWVLNAGQFRRALPDVYGVNFDKDGSQVMAVSDTFTLGTGTEPTATHQNPFTAAGQIARNFQELVRHAQPS